MTLFNEFLESAQKYATAYYDLEKMQKNRQYYFLPEHADQKTGMIGEAYIFEYLKRLKKLDLEFGRTPEKGWDIQYKENGKQIRIQVKTTSSFSKTRRMSPLHFGWDYLYVISLNEFFLPNALWIIEKGQLNKKEIGGKEKIVGINITKFDQEYFECKYFRSGPNQIESLMVIFKY